MYGRQISESDIAKDILKDSRLKKFAAITHKGSVFYCARCGSKINIKENQLPKNNYYCCVCIQMGRMDTLKNLVTVSEPNDFVKEICPLSWKGTLTSLQLRCSKDIVETFKERRIHLLWAVTGAGKTEMLFKGI